MGGTDSRIGNHAADRETCGLGVTTRNSILVPARVGMTRGRRGRGRKM